MGALDLVLGGRADSSIVREGAKEAEVEACFDETVIRRTVTREGRSRAWIDDESVSVAELKEFGRRRVDIHGPRANQNILEERFQRETLDGFGGVDGRAYGAAWTAYADLKAKIAALSVAGAAEDEIDLLRFQVNELEAAGLTADDDDIAARHAAAAHAQEIVEAANGITEALGGDAGAGDILAKLQPKFAGMARHFPVAEEWAAEAEDLAVRIQELSRTVADSVSKIDVDEEDFEELDRRLTLVNRLQRKYQKGIRDQGEGIRDQGSGIREKGSGISGLLELLEAKKAKLDGLEHREERLAELRKELSVSEKALKTAGAALTKSRSAAATKLAKAVTGELRDLGFLQAKFAVRLEAVEPEASGCDRVVYLLEPNPGEPARPLADIASSGEIARVMLALKTVLAAHDVTEVLGFDEIDANIGGEVGRVVGEKMRAVAKSRQVIAITHLPQSAVYGDRHLVVAKGVAGGRTRTRISEVTGEDRVSEIARMLGGEKLTSVTRKHAQELLAYGKDPK